MRLDELRKLAEAATPGPWTAMEKPGPSFTDHGWRAMAMCGSHQMVAAPYSVAFVQWDSEANAAYIAAANPAAVLQLIAVAEAAELALKASPYKPTNVEVALSMCRESSLEAKLPAPMCWDLALYVKRLEDTLRAALAALEKQPKE